MSSKHRVIGIGGNRTHLEGYIRSFASDPRCEVVAIADDDDIDDYRREQNQALAAELHLPYVSLTKAISMPGVDIACACPDVERRGRVLTNCLDSGLNVYMDKPLAGSVSDARKIADAARRSGACTQVFSQANTEWAQRAKRAVRTGAIGGLQSIHCDMLMSKGHLSGVPPGTVRRERGSDGKFTFVEAKRELFDMGVYPVSLTTWLSGQRVTEVRALTANYFFAEHAALDIEDFGAMLLTLENGTTATVMSGRTGVHSHPMTGQQQVTLVGENGYFRFADDEPRIEVNSQETMFEDPQRSEFDPMMMWASTRVSTGQRNKNVWQPVWPSNPSADIRAFVDCIESRTRPEITAEDALHHVEVIMAGYESASSGNPIKL